MRFTRICLLSHRLTLRYQPTGTLSDPSKGPMCAVVVQHADFLTLSLLLLVSNPWNLVRTACRRQLGFSCLFPSKHRI